MWRVKKIFFVVLLVLTFSCSTCVPVFAKIDGYYTEAELDEMGIGSLYRSYEDHMKAQAMLQSMPNALTNHMVWMCIIATVVVVWRCCLKRDYTEAVIFFSLRCVAYLFGWRYRAH